MNSPVLKFRNLILRISPAPRKKPGAYAKTGAPMFDSLDYKTNVNEKTYIYQLNLDKGKYYVGKTINIDRRMEQHFSGHGSKVTKKFKPITGQTVDSCYGFFGSKLVEIGCSKDIKH